MVTPANDPFGVAMWIVLGFMIIGAYTGYGLYRIWRKKINRRLILR